MFSGGRSGFFGDLFGFGMGSKTHDKGDVVDPLAVAAPKSKSNPIIPNEGKSTSDRSGVLLVSHETSTRKKKSQKND